jgi:hypothetical protein
MKTKSAIVIVMSVILLKSMKTILLVTCFICVYYLFIRPEEEKKDERKYTFENNIKKWANNHDSHMKVETLGVLFEPDRDFQEIFKSSIAHDLKFYQGNHDVLIIEGELHLYSGSELYTNLRFYVTHRMESRILVVSECLDIYVYNPTYVITNKRFIDYILAQSNSVGGGVKGTEPAEPGLLVKQKLGGNIPATIEDEGEKPTGEIADPPSD